MRETEHSDSEDRETQVIGYDKYCNVSLLSFIHKRHCPAKLYMLIYTLLSLPPYPQAFYFSLSVQASPSFKPGACGRIGSVLVDLANLPFLPLELLPSINAKGERG